MRKRRTPTILQMEATECGAAALGSILGYYDCFLPLEELRIACGVSRDGSKAVNMLKAARKYGLKANGAKVDLDNLQDINEPFIMFWEFNHFIVVDYVKKDKFYVNDPATGPRIITKEAMNKGFTGVVLIFEPTDQLVKSPKQKLLRRAFLQPLLANQSAITLILLTSFFLIIPGIIIPGFNKIFIDNILIQDMHSWIYPLILGLLIAAILQILLLRIQQKLLLKVKIKIILGLGANLVWHILHLPMQFFYQRYAGDIANRLDANDRISNLLSTELTASIVNLFSMIFFAIILLIINWKLGLIGITFAIFNLIIFMFIARRIEDKTRDYLQQNGRLTGIEMSSLQMIETIKATATEDDLFKRWSARHASIINLEQNIAFLNQILIIFPQLLNGISAVAILSIGSWFIMQGDLTVGSLVAFQSLLINFNSPLSSLLRLGNSIQQIRGDLLRVNDVLQYATTERNESEKSSDAIFKGELLVNDITFGYSRLADPLIQNFNLTIAAGQHIAIIGKTGSGKSTIAKLILNLYKPWYGEIKLDNFPLAKIPEEILAKSVAMVEQEIFLFEGTIRENLTLWDTTISDSILNNALKSAELYEELLPRGGLNCQLLEGGINLSGGQRQRLEIARALVNNPILLVLDEATASLDPLVEKQIFNNLKKLNITVIIVTHRITAIRDCDEIIVVDKGIIKNRGTHEQLLETANYRSLVLLEENE